MANLRLAFVVLTFGALQHAADARLGMGAQVLTASTFDDFIKKNDKVLVDFYDAKDPQWREGQGELDAAIRNVRDVGCKVPFAKVDASKETELAAKYVPDARYPQLLWFLHGELTQYHRTLRTQKAIGDFVMALDRDPMVPIQKEEEASDYNPAILARVKKGSAEFKTLQIVASKHMDTVAFTFLEDSSNKVSFIAAGSDPKKYEGELTVPALEKWVRMSLLKSEAIPEGDLVQDEGSRVVVGRNFEDVVLQKDKDVILQVYAPWCGFCKKFAPTWNQFAKNMEGVTNLMVAKMDGSRNSSPVPETFQWDAYPKIFYVRAGEEKPVHFSGERTMENLINFVKEHGSKTLNLEKVAESRGESAEQISDL